MFQDLRKHKENSAYFKPKSVKFELLSGLVRSIVRILNLTEGHFKLSTQERKDDLHTKNKYLKKKSYGVFF